MALKPHTLLLIVAFIAAPLTHLSGQVINGTGSYKGAAPGWDRGMETTMHCGNNPESWVRGTGALDKQSNTLSLTIQLETDSVLAGPKGRLSVQIRNVAGNEIYKATSDEIGMGGKPPGGAVIQNFSSTISIPQAIASQAESIYLDAECTGSVNRLFNLDLNNINESFLVVANSLRELTKGSPQEQQLVSDAFAAAAKTARPGTPEYTAAIRDALANGLSVKKNTTPAKPPTSIDLDSRYRQNFTDPTRVWGGGPVVPGTFPDTVAITGNGKICTGTLIGLRAVLTAAHCYCDGVKQTVYFGDTVSSATTTAQVATGQSMISCVLPLPLQSGDIAVLTLNASVTVPPRALATDALVSSSPSGQAVGFGVGSVNPVVDPAGIKRIVEVPFVSSSCSGKVTTPAGSFSDDSYYKCTAGRELVAGAPSLDKDTCKGDSGGPLFVAGMDGSLYLAATTSRATGTPGVLMCGDGGIYVRIDGDALKWIESLGINVLIGPH